ncbi:MAG: tetratricopeptide repeat protein [Chitinophagales bacterium]|nr:tetratricopeptide repeat protein [Chitinophagales bacterium]
MSDKKIVQGMEGSEAVIERDKDFWGKYSKPIIIACLAIIVAAGGWLIYKNFVQAPKEKKAAEAMFKAEDYYRMDSVNLALNGDGQNLGFLKVISKYDGTKAANLAHFYAGSCFIKLNDNVKAVSHLKDFSTSSKPLQARAYKLLGDAYADQGKNAEALSAYKKAARHFTEDKMASAEALFMAAQIAERNKNQQEAIELLKELKEKYPQTQQGVDADKYLAQMGVYNVN